MNLTDKEDYFYSLNWLQFLIIALGVPYHTWTALNKNFYTFENLQNFNFFNINTIFWIMHILRSQTFMLLSGFFLAKSFSQISIKKNLIKKTKKLLLPFIFGYVCLQPIISSIRSVTFASLYHTNTDFFKELFYSYQKLYVGSLYFGIFWFLCFLYIYESIFIIFFKTISNFKNLKLALYLVLLTTITCSYLYNKSIIWPDIGKSFTATFIDLKVSNFFYYFIFFTFGILFRIDVQLSALLKRHYFYFLQISSISLITIFIIGLKFNPESMFVIKILKILTLITTLSLVIGLFGMFLNCSNKNFNFVTTICKHSLEIYISHYLYIAIILMLLTQVTHNLPILFVSTTAGTFLLCALQIYLFSLVKINFSLNK